MKKYVAFYTTQKAASTFLVHFLRKYSQLTSSDFYSVNDEKTRQLIKEQSWATILNNASKDRSKSAVFGPIRVDDANPTFPTIIDKFCNIVHLRDPRDVMTSHFFSVVYSHPTRKDGFNLPQSKRAEFSEQGIDQYVLEKSKIFKRRYEAIIENFYKKNSIFVTYEQLVTDFSGWLTQVLQTIDDEYINSGIKFSLFTEFNHQFSVTGEDIYRHKRRVVPGDHKDKLQPETILQLNDIFENELHLLQNVNPQFGYI